MIIAVLVIVTVIILINDWLFASITYIPFNCGTIYGYNCNPAYHAATGYLSVTIKQNTQHTWTGWAIAYAPNGKGTMINGVPNVTFSEIPNATALPPLVNVVVSGNILMASNGMVPIGTPTAGTIWICYTTANNVTGMLGGRGTCTPIGNQSAQVTFIQLAKLNTQAT